MTVHLTAKDILGFLRKRHPSKEWAFLDELRIGTGYGPEAEQRLDAWALNLWPSKRHMRIAYEIKVSRQDFLHELAHPEKRQAALALSNQFYFAVPRKLISLDEIPPEAGVLEFETSGQASLLRPAPMRETPEPSWRFLASIARRTQDASDKRMSAQARMERFMADLEDCRWEFDRTLNLGQEFEDWINHCVNLDPMVAAIHDFPTFLDDNPARTEFLGEALHMFMQGFRLKVDLSKRQLILRRGRRARGLLA